MAREPNPELFLEVFLNPVRRSWVPFATSLAGHFLGVMMLPVLASMFPAPGPRKEIVVEVRPLEIRLPENMFLASQGQKSQEPRPMPGGRPAGGGGGKPGGGASQEARKGGSGGAAPTAPAPAQPQTPGAATVATAQPAREARPRFEIPDLPVRLDRDQTIIQPDTAPQITMNRDVRLPQVMFWASQTPSLRPPPAKKFVVPGRREQKVEVPTLDAPPKLESPTRALRVSEMKVAAALPVNEPALPAPPATTMPVRTFQPPPLEPPKEPVSLEMLQGDPTNLIAISPNPALLSEAIRVLPGSQLGRLPAPTAPGSGSGSSGGAGESGSGGDGQTLALAGAKGGAGGTGTGVGGSGSGSGDGSGAGTGPGAGAGSGGGGLGAGGGTGSGTGAGSGTGSGTGPDSGSGGSLGSGPGSGGGSGGGSGTGTGPGVGPGSGLGGAHGSGVGAGGGYGGGTGASGTGTGSGGAVSVAGSGSGGGTRSSSSVIRDLASGRFDVVVVQSSAAAMLPESRGLLTGKPVYTVYLHVGAPKQWILQYCIPRSNSPGSAAHGGVIIVAQPSPVRAPYPTVTMKPAPSALTNPRYIIVHGLIDQEGTFQSLRLVSGGGSKDPGGILPAMQQWRFRPATRDGQPVLVEVVVAIPPQPA